MKKLNLLFIGMFIFAWTNVFSQTINNVGPAYFPSGFYPFNSQLQTAQNNILMIEGNNVAGSNPVRNNIRVGIGAFPATAPVDRLHLNNINAVAVNLRITNSTTGATAGDGFSLGILGAGDAVLNQHEVLSMRFNTSNLERMRITAAGLVGINTTAPTNQLEINSSFGGCTSGLTFTQLNSLCLPVANPGPGVLSVDAGGKVIYVPGGGTVTGANNGLSVVGGNIQLGGACGSGLGVLTNTREIPMAGFNINHTMAAGSTSQVNIGAPICTTGVARFSVTNDFYPNAGFFTATLASTGGVRGGAFRGQNTGSGNANGVNCQAFTTNSSANAIAVNASSPGGAGFSSFYNIGVNANTANASFASISVNADVTSSSSPSNFGIESELTSGTNASATNIAGQFIVSGNPVGNVNIGIRALVPTATGGAGPDWAGFFGGDVFSTTNFFPSDRNLKKNIQPIEHSLDIVKKLNPVTYAFDTDRHPNLGLSTVNQWGFISQEVEQVLPELTKQTTTPAVYDSLGKVVIAQQEILTLNYNGFIAILTKAIQEQQQQIDYLTSLVQGQHHNPDQNNVNEQEVTLSNTEVIVLDQNAPNPFTNQTTINYYIPEDASVVQIQFFDMNGKMIKVMEVMDRGAGRLLVYAGELRDGVYSYSLVVDGKVIDTKRMIKTD
jgi:hypothetical protein